MQIKNQEPRIKSQESRAKNQEPRIKIKRMKITKSDDDGSIACLTWFLFNVLLHDFIIS